MFHFSLILNKQFSIHFINETGIKYEKNLKSLFHSPHIFFLPQLNPLFQETLVRAAFTFLWLNKLMQCLQLLQMHPHVNYLQNVLTEDLEMNAWCWSWSDSLWVWCHLTFTHRVIAQKWDPLQSALLENTVTQRWSCPAQTKAFLETFMGKRKGYNVVSQTAKGCLLKSKGEAGRELCIQKDGMQVPEAWHSWVNSWIQS